MFAIADFISEYVSEAEEVMVMDWEIPNAPDSSGFDDFTADERWDWLEAVIEAFEAHNSVKLEGAALRYLRESAEDFYTIR